MKKITLMMAAVAMSIGAFAQTTVQEATDGTFPTVINLSPNVELDPCSVSEASNGFENGLGNTNATVEVADNFTVAMGEDFSLESAIIYMITGGTFPSVTIKVYEDDGSGLPGSQVAEFADIVPTSQDDVGDAFGRDVLEVVIDFPSAIDLPGSVDDDTTYWLGIFTPNGTGADAFWETSTASSDGLLVAARLADGSGAWDNGGNPPACVFQFDGDCQPILGVEDNIADLVSIYPNPASDVLNIDLPSNVQIESAVLFDVLGKNTGVVLSNGTMNTSSLARGVYILNIETSAGTLSEKIVKQ